MRSAGVADWKTARGGGHGAHAHRLGGPLSSRPLSPRPYKAAAPKGPTFLFEFLVVFASLLLHVVITATELVVFVLIVETRTLGLCTLTLIRLRVVRVRELVREPDTRAHLRTGRVGQLFGRAACLAAPENIVAIAREARVRIDTGASAGSGMLSSSMADSALGGAPVCIDPPAFAGVSRSCQGAAVAALASPTASSIVRSLSATATAPASGTGAPAIAAYVRTGAAAGSDGGSAFGMPACWTSAATLDVS